MAIEAYAIGVSLVTNVNMGPLNGLFSTLEKIQAKAKDTQIAFNDMVGSLRGAARVANTLADAMERVAKAAKAAAAVKYPSGPGAGAGGAAGGGGGGASVSPGPRAVPPLLLLSPPTGGALVPYNPGPRGLLGGGAGGGGGGVPGLPGTGGLMPGGGGRGPIQIPPLAPSGGLPTILPKPSAHELTLAGVGAEAIGMAASGLIGAVFTSAEEIAQERVKMALAGFTPEQIKAAQDQAQQTQQNVAGSTFAGNMEIIRDFAGLIQNPTEATAALSDFAKMGQVLSTVGKGSEISELFEAMRAGELRGSISNTQTGEIDPQKFQAFLRGVESVAIATNGRVGPHDYAMMLQQAGIAGVRMDDKMLFQDMPSVMLAMKAVRSGTALSSLSQTQFGRLAKPYAEEQERLGLIDPGAYKYTGGGGGYIQKGGMPDAALMQTDLLAYIQKDLLPKMIAGGFKDTNSQLTELYKLFPRSTITRLMEDLIRNMPLVELYSKSIGNKMNGPDPFVSLSENNPAQAMAGFDAALKAFLATIGDPSMGAATGTLKDLTTALNVMSNWAKENPTLGRVLLDVAAGLAAVGTVAGAVLLAVGPVVALAKVLKYGGGLLGLGGAGAGVAGAGAAGTVASAVPGLGLLGGIAYGVKSGADAAGDWFSRHVLGWSPEDIEQHRKWEASPISNAPFSAAPGGGPQSGGSQGPTPVFVTNGRDMLQGHMDYLTHQANLPPAGSISPGPRATPYYPGMTPAGGY